MVDTLAMAKAAAALPSGSVGQAAPLCCSGTLVAGVDEWPWCRDWVALSPWQFELYVVIVGKAME
jgi:hypothetical protein